MDWTREQRKVIDTRDCNILVSAAAGSGKTAVLVERIIQMIFDKENPIDIDRLLVVTFTKAAAAQMKDKIAQAIEKKIDENPSDKNYVRQLNLLRNANILTIDSFCYKVVKEYFHVVSIDPKVRVAEESELEIIKHDVIEAVMEEYYRDNKDFVEFSDAFSADKSDVIIEEYIIKLYELSESYPFPKMWLCNAKNNLCVDKEEDLIKMDFMKAYINEVHVNAREIKDTILKYLEMAKAENGPKHYEETLLSDIERLDDIISANTYKGFNDIYSGKFMTLKRAKKSDVFDVNVADKIKAGRDRYKKQINSALEMFSLPISKVLEQFKASEKMLGAFVDAAMDFSQRYLERKLELGLIGFSDVEHYALQILCKGRDDDGNLIPSEAGKELSDRFYEILIDEYQDSNFLQEDILRCVSKVPYGVNNIFMVGDVKQSIYAFRMARPDLFTGKYNTYTDITNDDKGVYKDNRAAVKIILQNNFRSRKTILDYTNYIFYQVMRGSLGGVNYSRKEALNAGRRYPDYEEDMVELLLGETKDFSDNSAADNALVDNIGDSSADMAEHLDDEYIDVSGMELEAGMVAERISRLIGDGDNPPHMVTDELTGSLRPVEYKDIVILFRAPKAYQSVFSEILMKRNIPVKLQNENGYFDMVEILNVMSFLKVLDNPYNDVECAALLRGYFGGLDNNEIAILSIMRRFVKDDDKDYANIYNDNWYSFIASMIKHKDLFVKLFCDALDDKNQEKIREYSGELLYERCVSFVDSVEHFQKQKNICSITELIEKIYFETGYYYYVKAMPQGSERSRNLMLFLDETKKFEHGGTKTLFDFLRFVKRISEKQITLGGEASSEASENMVRIMSIHRSKGLEFPVVFVSGLGKKFNMSDTRLPLILHSDYYISAKYVNNKKRCSNDTFMRKAVAALMRSEVIAEELRVFYVALTRAKEKLILTGVTPDIAKLLKKLMECALCSDTQLPHNVLGSLDSYLELLLASLMRSHEFYDVLKRVAPRIGADGNIVSASYDVERFIDTPAIKTIISFFTYSEIVHLQIDTGVRQGELRQEQLDKFINKASNNENEDKLMKNLCWKYADEDIKNQKSKMSVTEIKRLHQLKDKSAADEEKEDKVYQKYKETIPRFIAEKPVMDASTKGTWFHKVMELVDNKYIEEGKGVKDELERLYKSGLLPEETKEFITDDKISAFSKSMLGIRMHNAAMNNKLFKERKFVVGFPVKENAPQVVVQGIIDAYFEEDGKLVLLDYKTDKIKAGQENVLVDRYYTQLDYYKRTLEKLTGMEVAEVYLYSFALDKEIKM